MLKKISVVLCAGLFATAFAAGCKKDEKKEGGADMAATCDGVAAKVASEMMKSAGDQTKADPGKLTEAIAKACRDDKWSDDALKCSSLAKDTKEECKGKLSAEQEANMLGVVKGVMLGATASDVKAEGQGTGTGTAVDPGAGAGTGTGTGTAPTAAAPPAGSYPETCEGVAARAAVEVQADMPPGAPADVGARLGTLITTRCTEDKWSADVIKCGVTAADPKKDCQSMLTEEQRTKLDADQEKLGKELFEAMAGSAGAGAGAGGPSGIAECDAFMAEVEKISGCKGLPADAKQGLDAMKAGFGNLSALPDDQKAMVTKQCQEGTEAIKGMAATYGC